MPTYFFHIDGERPHRDVIGEDLPHDEAAWVEALRLTRDIEGMVQPGQRWTLEVHDGNRVLYRVAITTERCPR
jgi:hypothetical protein